MKLKQKNRNKRLTKYKVILKRKKFNNSYDYKDLIIYRFLS